MIAPGVLIATGLSAYHYSSKPLWRDEWFTYGTVERPFTSMVRLLSDTDGGLAGFYLVMHVWMLLGDSVPWLRLPAALGTALTAALTALLGRRVGGPVVGAVSGALVAMMPTVVEHAQEARAYPLVMAAVTATGLAALRYQERPSRGRWAAFTALGGLAVALHPLPGAPAVAGIFVGLLFRPGRAPRRRVLLAATPAGLVAVALVGLGAVQTRFTDAANTGGLVQVTQARHLMAPGWGLLFVLMALCAVSLGVLRHQEAPLVVLLAWSALPVASLVALTASGSFFKPRYASTLVPPATVLVAVGLVAVGTVACRVAPHARRAVLQPLTAAVATVGVMAALAPAAEGTVNASFRTDDPRAATDVLFAEHRAGDAVVCSGTMSRGLTEFYAPSGERLPDPLLLRSPLESDTIQGEELSGPEVASAVAPYERLWIAGTMSGPGEEWSTRERVATAVAGRRLVEEHVFGRYRIQLWVAAER